MKKFLLSLATVAMAAGAYADDNLLVNGDFESWADGKATNWESPASKSTVSQSSAAHGGSYAAQVAESTTANQRIAYKALSLEAGQYVFSGYLKSASTTLCTVTPGYGPVSGETASYNALKAVSGVKSTEWVQFKDTFTVAAKADVTVYLTLKKSTGDLLFDDASLVKIAGASTSSDNYVQDFTAGRGAWTINDVIKPEAIAESSIWTNSTTYGMVASAQINSVKYATESWLISPVITLKEGSKLTYSQAGKYFTDMTTECTVNISEDGKTWTALTPDASLEGKDWNYVDTNCDLTKYANKKVYIGFKYTSTAEGASKWEIKKVTVTNASSDAKVELQSIANTKENAYTTAQVIEILKADNKYNLKDSVYVKGTVSKVESLSASSGAMIYWLDENAFEVYYGLGLNSAKFESLSDVNPGDQVVVKGLLALYGSTYEITGSYMVEHQKTGTVVERKDPSNTAETAYTVAEAKAILDKADEYDLSKTVYVKGTISSFGAKKDGASAFNSSYGSITYWLDEDAFEVYSGLNFGKTKFSSADDLKVGDEVIVCGVIKLYNGTYEFDKNNYLVTLNGVGIKNVVSEAAGKQIYNLLGERVADMSKRGVYVVNGKKVVVK